VYSFVGLVTLVLVAAALIDIITRDNLLVRHLPKVTWVILVIFLPVIGSIVWFAVGHDWGERRGEAIPFGDPRRHEAVAERLRYPEPAFDDAELEAELRRAEKEARLRRLEAEVAAKRAEREKDAS
jgi:hypothetical protein